MSLSFIRGIAIGIEYVPPIPEENIPNMCVIIDLVFFRIIIEIA